MLGGRARLAIAIAARNRKVAIHISFILFYYLSKLTQIRNYHQHYNQKVLFQKTLSFHPQMKRKDSIPSFCFLPIYSHILQRFLALDSIIPEDLLQQMNQVIEQVGNYRILKSHPLGSGATGSVFYGQNKSGIKVAVKSIDIKKINKGIEKQIENEIKNLTALQSPFIVKLFDYFRSGENIYMVLEYCEDGDLKNYLEKNRKNQGLSEAEAQTFMRHLTQGYLALLKQSIIHRDIKPANILLKQGVAKLSDFGFSRVVEDPNKTQKLTLLGTPLYTAPQILANKEFSNKCDVWSMGVVFYEMLHGRTPWTGTDLENLRTNIEKKKLEWKPNINPQIKNLISKMLQIKTDDRIRWEQLLTFPLFAKPMDLGIQKQKMETSFPQALKILMEYLKNFLVKSYLIIDTNNEVNFAPSQQPLETPQKSQDQLQVEKETNYLTRRRNFAFLHMYVLALYQKNKAIIPKEAKVNQYMELEYGLIKKAYDLIMTIGEDFNLNNTKGEKRWQNYKKTPQYAELNALLSNDFKLLDLLLRSCKATIVQRLAKNTMPPQTKEIYEKYEKKFDKVFKDAMMSNANELAALNIGVCRLLQDYLVKYILSPEQILDNNQLDLASNYEKREKDYKLD